MNRRGIPFLVYAVTSLHVGMGRSSSGVVDLPIQRDPEGFPIIFSSSFKGALKQYCGASTNAIMEGGRIDCTQAKICCCLFGGENETDVTSIVSLSDLYPLAIPVPSLDKGYVYLTSKYLIDTIIDLFNAVNYQEGVSALSGLQSTSGEKKGEGSQVIVGTDFKVNLVNIKNSNFFKSIMSLGSIAEKIKDGLAVEMDDSNAVLEIERGIIKYTRNKIKYDTGTVMEHSLWTEEYLPHGIILAGVMFFNVPRRNKYCKEDGICDEECAKEKVNQFVTMIKNNGQSSPGQVNEFYLNVGGKETIGKGIVKVKLLGEIK